MSGDQIIDLGPCTECGTPHDACIGPDYCCDDCLHLDAGWDGYDEPAARPAAGDTRTDRERLRDALRIHHPIMRSETGPLSGCRCGQVGLGQDVIGHVVTELRAALDGEPQP